MGDESFLAAHPKPVRIVWAEDDPGMRAHVTRLLSPPYAVEAVEDGEAALAAARRQVPELVLADVVMPNLDGFGLLMALRADPRTRTVPLILVSGRVSENALLDGLQAGADDYLIKPFSPQELLARVNVHVKMSRLRREHEALISADLQAMNWLYEVATRCVQAGNNVQHCLDEIVAAAIALTGADKGNLQILDRTSGILTIAAHKGLEAPFLDFFRTVGADDASACAKAMQAGKCIVVDEVAISPIFSGSASQQGKR
ncbi:response regulator transcription factor [Tahibacter amnicola]|uniref:Response regulator transcription factor n=1 Tax=Tahibacter amnicola TaxID=2976241 RepID=A0ABY6B6X9_9GAMM|nr:response regulator transcription factor [Tahibacter amnicola]UXI65856.1 response regulator transcription factor [Tahibacter amnicola]